MTPESSYLHPRQPAEPEAQAMRPRVPCDRRVSGWAWVPRVPSLPTAMTLLETVLAMSLLTIISVASAQVVRTAWQAWDIQDRRSDVLQHLGGTLAHVTRHLRMCRNVISVSGPTDTSGNLEITLPNDSVVKWYHDNVDRVVRYEIDGNAPGELLATGIDELKFECFEIDGVTPTTVPADVRMIRTTVTVTIPVQETPLSLSSTVWIRKQRDALASPFIDFYATSHGGGASWNGNDNLPGPPDGLLSYGTEGAKIDAQFSVSGYTGTLGTVLVGLYLKTEVPMGDDVLEIQICNRAPSDGPIHTFGQRPLLRFEDNIDWFWVDVTDDYASWSYEDLADIHVDIDNEDSGAGGTTIYVDSVKIRTFETAPLTQTFWLTGVGTQFNEWGNTWRAVGPPDAVHAYSLIFSIAEWDIDRQDYFYAGSWEDLGTITRVRLVITNYYVTAAVVDDEFHARLPLTTESGEIQDTAAPNTAEQVPLAVLNQHVGSANPGTEYLDFSNLESWTWTGIRSRLVRLYMSAIGLPEAEIYVDGVAVEVRYVPPNEAAVVLWEEL